MREYEPGHHGTQCRPEVSVPLTAKAHGPGKRRSRYQPAHDSPYSTEAVQGRLGSPDGPYEYVPFKVSPVSRIKALAQPDSFTRPNPHPFRGPRAARKAKTE